MSDKADWAGVGDAFKTLGRQLKDRTIEGADAVQTSTREVEGAAEQLTTAFKTAFAKLDETTTDPEIKQATKTATARFLDALKAELTGEDDGPADGDPPAEPPKPIAPGPIA